jgi:hypothetical protein
MNCTKCGKEIPDGEKEICDECEKKLEAEKAEAEKKEKVETKENSTEKASKEEKKEKKAKTEKVKKENKNAEQKNSSSKKTIIAIICILLVIVVVAIVFLTTGKNKIGNTIGNIRNYGYAAAQGNYIYYLSPNEDSTQVGIFRVKTNGEDKKELFMGENLDIVSINVSKNYVYFIGVGTDAYSDDDDVDNKIYRMKLDGSDLEVINDNEFNNNCYEIYVIGNSVYYIGTDANIYKMKIDGSDRELVLENGTGYLGITDKYIIYNKETGEEDYTTYIMNINGENDRPIVEGKRLYSVNISGDYVYYTNEDKQIYKTKLDSNEEELVLDTTAYNMNLKDDYIYYLNYKDLENEDYTVCIYRLKLDGSEPERIKELATYSSFIDIIDDWVIYMDSDDTSGFINIVKTDGSDEKQLYLLDYEEYYSSLEDESYNEDELEEDTTDIDVEDSTEDTNTTATAETTTENTVAENTVAQ